MITSKKKFRQTSLEALIFGLFIVAIAGLLALSNWQIGQRRKQLLARIKDLENQIETLEEENQQLKEGISQTSEKVYLEKEAIERFNLKPPGTQVVVVKKEEGEEPTTTPQKSFWENILERLGVK